MIFKEKFEMSRYGTDYEGAYLYMKLLDKGSSLEYNKKIAKLSKDIKPNDEDVENIVDKSGDVIEVMYSLIEDMFLGGQLYKDDVHELRDATKEDIASFPISIIRDLVSFVNGNLEKKS